MPFSQQSPQSSFGAAQPANSGQGIFGQSGILTGLVKGSSASGSQQPNSGVNSVGYYSGQTTSGGFGNSIQSNNDCLVLGNTGRIIGSTGKTSGPFTLGGSSSNNGNSGPAEVVAKIPTPPPPAEEPKTSAENTMTIVRGTSVYFRRTVVGGEELCYLDHADNMGHVVKWDVDHVDFCAGGGGIFNQTPQCPKRPGTEFFGIVTTVAGKETLVSVGIFNKGADGRPWRTFKFADGRAIVMVGEAFKTAVEEQPKKETTTK